MRCELAFTCPKKDVLESIQCYENSPSYTIYDELFEELILENQSILKPIGFYTIAPKKDALLASSQFFDENSSFDENYDAIVACIVTLGKAMDLKINAYFEELDYMKGVLMSAIADAIIFSASNTLYHQVFADVKALGMQMTKRHEPGSGGSKVTAQKWLLETINANEDTGITITSGYMLNPTKSMGYFYGAGTEIAYTPFDHDCSQCDHIHCHHRKVYLTVITDQEEHILRVKKGSNLLEVLREYHLPIQADCSGNKTCGKCKVRVLHKKLPLNEEEATFLTANEIANGTVLACFQYLHEDTIIELKNGAAKILAEFDFPPIHAPKYKVHAISELIKKPESNESAVELVARQIQPASDLYKTTFAATRQLSHLLKSKSFYATLKDKTTFIGFHLDKPKLYGFGMDIGTTTVAISLVDLLKNKVIETYKCLNPQKAYGADVISRIQYVSENENTLTQGIRDALLEGMSVLMKGHKIKAESIQEVAIAGNTTMVYLLTGIAPASLAVSPFLTTHTDLMTIPFQELFQPNHKNVQSSPTNIHCMVHVLPGLSAYIGADILSGLYTTDFHKQTGNYLFLDIGTNGELAINANGRLLTVATAAGPAFEGANITCGMGSLEGAICGVTQEEGDFQFEIIGHGVAKGICGSGLIDIMAICLDLELVDETGRMNEGASIPLSTSADCIALYQKDVRELQLAKAAIAAGIDVLLKECQITIDQVDQVLLAGGFGHHLNVQNAIRIGLLPKGIGHKTKVIGNSALGGSIRYLLEKEADKTLDQIKKQCEYVELSTHPLFNDLYMDHMMFEEV